GEIEVEGEQRRHARPDYQVVTVVERHGDVDDAERITAGIHRLGGDWRAVLLKRDVGIGVVELDGRGNVIATRDGRRGQELGEVDVLREVDAGRRRQCFHHRAVGPLQ